MNPSFDLSNMKSHPVIAVALSVLLVFLPGCAASMAQQEIDTLKEHAIAIQKASEFIRLDRLERNSKCRGAHEAFVRFTRLPPGHPDISGPDLRPTLDYLRRVYTTQRYMNEKKVTAETALTVIWDLVLPRALAPEIDPFNGCMVLLGKPPDKPYTRQGGKPADDFVFYWQSRDWREGNQAVLKIWEKFLPSENRTPFDHFVFDYALTLSNTLMEREEKGEITLLSGVKGWKRRCGVPC